MAYEYQDPMGNMTGYVDQEAQAEAEREEEERKRKEAERLAKERDNLAVHKQEVTTYANGSKTITNVAEVPATADAPGRPTGPVAPKGFQGQTDEFGGVDEAVERQRKMNQQEQRQEQRQQPVAPVAPGTVFERQIQAESGGRHIDPRTGQIMTSPKGALGVAQIMPATARQPGYGIAPITDEELRTPEGNMAFGQRYKEGMLRVFNGDEEKATASYNAGPGAVQKAVRRAEQQGGDYKDYLPRETQNYLQKVFGGQAQQQQQRPQQVIQGPQSQTAGAGRGMVNPERVNAPVAPDDSVINNQVADYERRQAPTAVAPAPINPEAPVAEAFTGQGLRMPGQPSGVASSASAIDAYQQRQDNPTELMKLGSSDDPAVPDFIKQRSRNRAADLITQEREMARAKEVVATSSESDIAKYLRKKTEGGSYLKLALYGLLGMENSGMAEAAKLGIGSDKAVTGADGKPYIIKTSANGTPLEGFDGETGKALTAQELVKVAAGGNAGKVSTSAEQFQDKDGNIYRSQSDDKGRLVTKNIVTGEVYKGDPTKLTRVRDVASQTSDERKQGFRRENDATSFANSIRKLDYSSKLKAVEEFQQAAVNRGEPLLSDAELSAMGVDRPDLGPAPTRQQAPAKPQQAQGQGQAEPQAQTQGKLAPAVPTGQAQLAPVNPNAPAPGTSVTGRITPSDQKRREKEEEVDRAGRKEAATTEGKVAGGIAGKELTNKAHAKEVYDLIQPIQTALKDATGSGLGTKVDDIAAFFGASTKGAEASAQLKVLGAKILMNVPRFEGPQSDKDVAAYKEAAGSLADSTLPIKQRSAALKTIIDLNKKYAPDLDWDFSKPQTREKVIGGVTYVHDGKGWKPK